MPNATVFIVRDKGAVVLTDEGFSTLPGSASVSMRKFAKGADGTLYALTSKAIFALRAGKLERMADISYDTMGTVSVFDVDSNGVFWAAGSKGVHHHEKGAWVTETLADVGLPDTHFTGLAIDGDNLPWLSTSKDLAHRVEGGWAPVELSGKKKLRYFRSMSRGPDGAVFLSAMDKLYQLNPTPAVIKVKKPRYSSLGDIAFSQAGVGAIKTGTDSVGVFLPKDKATTYGKKDFNVGMISSVAVDDQARVWVAGDGGVVILGPDDLRVTWRSGAIEQVAGKVSHIMTVGVGPKLPEAGERKKGGLKGKIVKAGAGVGATKVELCEAPSMFPKKTPCTGAPTHLQGETDADGNFEFKDVPLGAYGIAVKSGKKWQVTLGAALGSKMVEGETFDIGSVELKDK